MGTKHLDELRGPQDGYFHHTQLKKITNWDYRDPMGCFQYMQSLWRWPDYITFGRKYVYISTGGWSGHEEALGALKENYVWFFYWQSSRRGGHYVFRRKC